MTDLERAAVAIREYVAFGLDTSHQYISVPRMMLKRLIQAIPEEKK